MKAHQHDNKHIQDPPFKKILTFINIGGKQKNNPEKDEVLTIAIIMM